MVLETNSDPLLSSKGKLGTKTPNLTSSCLIAPHLVPLKETSRFKVHIHQRYIHGSIEDGRMQPGLIKRVLDKKNMIAVVGASRNPEKYGHQVYKDLKTAGYRVYPVNPDAKEILGDKVYPDLKSLSAKPDVVNIVVPPKVTEEIVKTCKELGITTVWMQPGSESEEAIKFCEANGIDFIHGVCIMVERRNL